MGSQGGGVSGDVDAWPAIPELPDSRAHEKSDCRNVLVYRPSLSTHGYRKRSLAPS